MNLGILLPSHVVSRTVDFLKHRHLRDRHRVWPPGCGGRSLLIGPWRLEEVDLLVVDYRKRSPCQVVGQLCNGWTLPSPMKAASPVDRPSPPDVASAPLSPGQLNIQSSIAEAGLYTWFMVQL